MASQPRLTRAMSRSVDPTAAAEVQKPTSKAKGKRKDVSLAPLGEEDAMADDNVEVSGFGELIPDDIVGPSVSGVSAHTGADEDAVDEILKEDDDKEDIEESADDAQTRRALENPTGNSATADDQESDDEDSDEEFARRMQDRPRTQASPKARPQLQPETTAKPSPKIDLANIRSRPTTRKQQPLISTPLTRRTRAGRAAAKQAAAAASPVLTGQREAFPSPGTRASEVREQWNEASRREEYQPPVGTKARELKQRTRR